LFPPIDGIQQKGHYTVKTRVHSTLLFLVFSVTLAVAACGPSQSASNEVSMVTASFSTATITIRAGQAVHFTDPAGTGATHIICLGEDGSCATAAQGPADLQDPGFTINAGDQAREVTFSSPGSYKITCSIHPSMNLTVIVQ
jgi:plastocyanin